MLKFIFTKTTALLYDLFKIPAKLAFLIWCRYMRVNKKNILHIKGPALIAANHPDSFLDAIILCSIFDQPIYALARGDAFKNKFYNLILRSLKMFPVYRLSEGAEHLEHNYQTFDECIRIFRKNGIVLIFSEGKCINEWHLRPLKKGTARLAVDAWEKDIPLKVIPLGINYNSFTSFGKNIFLNFGETMSKEDFSSFAEDASGAKIQQFNDVLKAQLQKLVAEIKPVDPAVVKKLFAVPVPAIKKVLLFVPACLGWLLNALLYIPVQKFAKKKFGKIDHYDSVVVGLLFFTYPFYLLLISLVLFFVTSCWWSFAAFILLPFTAWAYVQLKKQF